MEQKANSLIYFLFSHRNTDGKPTANGEVEDNGQKSPEHVIIYSRASSSKSPEEMWTKIEDGVEENDKSELTKNGDSPAVEQVDTNGKSENVSDVPSEQQTVTESNPLNNDETGDVEVIEQATKSNEADKVDESETIIPEPSGNDEDGGKAVESDSGEPVSNVGEKTITEEADCINVEDRQNLKEETSEQNQKPEPSAPIDVVEESVDDQTTDKQTEEPIDEKETKEEKPDEASGEANEKPTDETVDESVEKPFEEPVEERPSWSRGAKSEETVIQVDENVNQSDLSKQFQNTNALEENIVNKVNVEADDSTEMKVVYGTDDVADDKHQQIQRNWSAESAIRNQPNPNVNWEKRESSGKIRYVIEKSDKPTEPVIPEEDVKPDDDELKKKERPIQREPIQCLNQKNV